MTARSARVRALAKVNLELRVLGRRSDGYHELRTVFQTISLADTIDIAFTPARRTTISVTADVEIPGGNIMERAAELALEAMRRAGRVEMRLRKRIPMGAGLGGGSSDAAAVLLALPVLAGKALALAKLMDLAAALGSDVPFLLLGGTAVGLGRGTEIYPLPDRPAAFGVLIAPGIHVSTAEAYRDLGRPELSSVAQPVSARSRSRFGADEAGAGAERPELTSGAAQSIISVFQSSVWDQGRSSSESLGSNDFEAVVFERYPRLKALKRQLERLGATPAMLSGSGSALFGVFGGRGQARRAREFLGKEQSLPIRFVTRASYRARWWRELGAHVADKVWPPQSRYA
jgi:4-diphosphocytidyl-2-C-methyl-D-erythritol kinase